MNGDQAFQLVKDALKRIETKVDCLADEVSELKGEGKGRSGTWKTIWIACSASAALGVFLITFANAHIAVIGGLVYVLVHSL